MATNAYVYRVKLIREPGARYLVPDIGTKVTSQETAFHILKEYLRDVDREHFVVLLLDQKYVIIGLSTIAQGTLTAALVQPREVFTPALLGKAAAVILAHNHPSGDVKPSRDDREVTERLKAAGEILGVQVLDHLIIGFSHTGEASYYSFAEKGVL